MDGLTCSPLDSDQGEASTEIDSLGPTNFHKLGQRVLCLQVLAGVSAAIYAWQCRNTMIMEAFLSIFQVWFLILIWCLTLPERSWRLFLLSICSIVLVHAVPVQLLTRLHPDEAGRGNQYQEGSWTWHIYTASVYALQSTLALALCALRVALGSLYSEQELCRIVLQCTVGILRVGILQLSILTVALAGHKSRSFQEMADSATNYPQDEETFNGLLTAVQAMLAGFAVNFFLLHSIMSRHVLGLELMDLVRNRVGPLEYLSGMVQLVVVVSISISLTMSPEDVADFMTERNEAGPFQSLLVWGYLVPFVLLNLLCLYYCWIQRNGSRKWAFFQERHDRMAKRRTIEQRLAQAEAERRHLYDLAAESLRRSSQAHQMQNLQKLVVQRREGLSPGDGQPKGSDLNSSSSQSMTV